MEENEIKEQVTDVNTDTSVDELKKLNSDLIKQIDDLKERVNELLKMNTTLMQVKVEQHYGKDDEQEKINEKMEVLINGHSTKK